MANGVVHVGAHRGEEVAGYLAAGRSPIICFEPQRLWDPPAGVELVRCALSDRHEYLTLRVPHRIGSTELDTQMASCLPLIPERAAAVGWTVTPMETIRVNACKFDWWAYLSNFENGSCSLLVVDAQGMAMQVLKGMEIHLSGFENLVVECSETPIWEGESSAKEIVAFLAKHGFKPDSPIVTCGDIKFSKGSVAMSRVPNFEQVMEVTNPISGNAALEDPEALGLYNSLKEVPPLGIVVEIGCQLGRSSSIIAQLGLAMDFFCLHIDPYTEQPEYLKGWVEMMHRIGGNMTHRFLLACMRTEQADWILGRLGAIDLAFVDGDHEYPSVMIDLEMVASKIRRGGLLTAHDYANEGLAGVKKALDEYTASGLWEKVGVFGSLGVWRRL